MFALVVRFDVLPEQVEAFDDLAGRTIAAIRASEPGTLVYLSTSNADDPNLRIFLEVYRDRAAFEEHESMPHVKEFLERRRPMLRSFEVDVLESIAGTIAGGDVADD